MFERFTGRARRVVALAQEEARGLGHDHIGTEHLLLGLLREEDGVAARALASLGLTADTARARVLERVGRGQGGPAEGQMRFSPKAKKVLELALREAIALGHTYIGTEHVLLGLLRADDGAGAAVLHEVGDFGRIRDATVALAPGTAGPPRRGGRRGGPFFEMRPPHDRWEYRVESSGALEEGRLNELGAEGWELVSVLPGDRGPTAVFKRPGRGHSSLRRAG